MFIKSELKMSTGLINNHNDDNKQTETEIDLRPRDELDDPLAIMW